MRWLAACLLLMAIVGSSEVGITVSASDSLPTNDIPQPTVITRMFDSQEPVTIISGDIPDVEVDQIISYVMAARLNNTTSNNTILTASLA